MNGEANEGKYSFLELIYVYKGVGRYFSINFIKRGEFFYVNGDY